MAIPLRSSYICEVAVGEQRYEGSMNIVLRKTAGFVLLAATLGIASCQAFVHGVF